MIPMNKGVSEEDTQSARADDTNAAGRQRRTGLWPVIKLRMRLALPGVRAMRRSTAVRRHMRRLEDRRDACPTWWSRSGFALLTGFVMACQLASSAWAAELWVSPGGRDSHPGTREQPLRSPALALRKARELRRLSDPSVTNGVQIILRGGVYPPTTPLLVRPEDSGTELHPTIIQSAPGEAPVLSGGVLVTGWRKAEESIPGLPAAAQRQVWMAAAPLFNGRPLEFRQLWVNNQKAIRAREPDAETMERLAGWNAEKEEAWMPAAMAGPYRTLAGMEMTLLQMWEIAILRLKSIDVEGEKARVTFHEPESRIEFEHPWPQPVMEPEGAPFFLAGAIEFLDTPGEWFQDPATDRILYWPRAGQDLSRDRVIVPALETLVQVSGSLDRPVEHVSFQGVNFQHTTWMRPSEQGHVPLQAGMHLVDAYKLRPKGTPDWRSLDNQAWIGRLPAAVTVEGAHHTRFERCRFQHLAAAGLDYIRGTRDDVIEGCVFRDIGGNGIQMGCFHEGGIEAHLPYHPADTREISTRERIANNLVIDCGTEDWGCVGIGVGFVPPFLDRSQLKDVRAIDQERAFEMCRRLAGEAGIFCGGSTGLNVVAAIELARETGPGKRIVTLGCDNGAKYLGGHIYRRSSNGETA